MKGASQMFFENPHKNFVKFSQHSSAIVVNNKSTTLINTLSQLGLEQFLGTLGQCCYSLKIHLVLKKTPFMKRQ
jgi:hypothetical protein